MSLDTEFRELCLTAGTPPNVFQFLQDRQPSEPEQWLAILHAHQQHLWRVDQPLVVEDYLAALSQMPGLPDQIDWRLQLVIGELEARRKTANPLSDAEISSRFPDLSDTLRQRLQSASSVEEPSSERTISSPDIAPSDQVIDSRATHSIGIDSIIGNSHSGAEHKGRYRLDRVLGEGTFGRVYLAYDQDLHRQVAVKVPAKGRFESPDDAESYLAEARTVASLDHPHIVSVYDMGRAEDGSVYVVSRYIEGTTLEAIIREGRATPRDSAVMIATVANALQYAHDKRLIHRDIKPANILIDGKSGTPFVADFGLAIREDDYLKLKTIAGTPAYMSPEQARGEGHRLDGRSDIFALGVILYEMLSGKKPFEGRSIAETLESVISHLPTPLRELDATIDAELERICLKALSKRASNRYSTAAAMADDSEAWLQPKPETNQPQPEQKAERLIVPRGLRSFGPDDADFFLDLLPGPRSRQGLPESIAFWKQRIEQTDPEQTFSVGLIYGPSGCGKSSLVKAGLLPYLSDMVIAVYVEATSVETETRVLRGLQKRLPELSPDLGLADTLAALRRGEGNKVIIIIDQFEQWLHAHRAAGDAELVKALRQCDGGRVQAILMIRDDFYVAALRLMQALDIEVVPGENFLLVDLYEVDHAEKVLVRFGQAFGKLPANATNLSSEQAQFVSRVASGLAQDGKVVSVRLSLLAEMVKGKPWQPTTLDQVGGTQGIGFNFLEETFASAHADPRFRRHAVATRGVLGALLPELDTDIKGSMRSHADLLAASGYQDRATDFNELLRILDSELRLITPTDPEGEMVNDSPASDSDTARYYQLTHDYLVPSLRQWLTRKQQETPKGRAELKLAERASLWHAKPEKRYLPSPWEWFTIRRLTDSAKWKPQEKAVMRRAGRVHATRAGLLTTVATALLLSGVGVKRWNDARILDRDATNLVSSIESADYDKLPEKISQLDPMRSVAVPKLQLALEQHDPKSDERLKLSLGLLASDPGQVEYLLQRLLTAEARQVPLLVDQLMPHAEQILPQLWIAAKELKPKSLLQAASALAAYDPSNEDWQSIAAQTANQVVRENPLRIATWIETLRPVASQLNPELKQILTTNSNTRSQPEIDLATDLLETYAAEDSELLHELILVGGPRQFARFFSLYSRFRPEAIERLRGELAKPFQRNDSESEADVGEEELHALRLAYIARQANAAVALLRLDDATPVYEFLTVDRDLEALSQFIYRIRGREVSSLLLIKGFEELRAKPALADPLQQRQHLYRLYGFLLGLGELTYKELPAQQRDALVEELADMYAGHPSRAIHSALGWLLRRWGQDELVRRVDETPLDYDTTGQREWFVMKIEPPALSSLEEASDDAESLKPVVDISAPIFFTMIVFPGGEFAMGEPEDSKLVAVAGPIAVSDREVTWRQFSAIDGDTHRQRCEREFKRSLGPEDPAIAVNWFEAVNYCRWLTSARGLGEEFQSYVKLGYLEGAADDPGWLDLPVNTAWPMRVDRPGFRLPTEAEWEYVAHTGTETTYSFGESVGLLGEYCWYEKNTNDWSQRAGQLRPSVGGLFDIHGNLWEWVDDWYTRSANRVYCGGSWGSTAAGCQLAFRSSLAPASRPISCGFRLALSPSGISGVAEPASAAREAEPAGEGTEGVAEQRP